MTGPVFRTDFDPRHGEMVQVSPLLRRLVCNNPSKFTFHGTGTYVIGRGDVAVVDPGPRDPAHVDALLAALDGERIRHVLITHTHGDHSPAAAALAAASGADVLGFGPHPQAATSEGDDGDDDEDDDDDEDGTEGDPEPPRTAEELRRAAEDVEKHRPDVDFAPDERLSDGSVVEGPGWTVEALHTPGHISNHLCFALREEQAVLSGDHVMGWSSTIIPPPTATWPHTSGRSSCCSRHRPGPVSDAWRTGRRSPALRAVAARPPPLTRAPDPGTARSGPASARDRRRALRRGAQGAPPSGRPVGGGPSAQALDEGHAAPVIRDESTVSSRVVWELT
ncbi:MAG: MBL fold metallo-hydrolase [Acidimicrobiales bacterium]